MGIDFFLWGKVMGDPVAAHYTGAGSLADRIAERLQQAGKDLNRLQTTDLAGVDEFHIRGRPATLELAPPRYFPYACPR